MSPCRPIAMSHAALAVCAVVSAGCGRYGFDSQGAGSGSACGQGCDALDAGREPAREAGVGSSSPDAGMSPHDAGTVRDGGTLASSDGATPTGDGAVPPPVCTQGLFCSGFEWPMFNDWTRAIAINGRARQAGDPVLEGTYSLAASASAPGGVAMLTKRGFGPFSADFFHVRAHYFVPSGTPLTEFAVLTVGDATLALSGGVSVFVANGGFALVADTGGIVRSGTLPVPVDRWFCLELGVGINADSGSATLWLDGAEDNRLSKAPTLPVGGVTTVGVGIVSVGAGQPRAEVLVDQLVVDTRPIGCE